MDEDWVNVAKTAEFTNGRRILAGWIPNKKDNKDNGNEIFGGNIVIRELTQEEDGTLNTGLPKEALPTTGARLMLSSATSQHVKKNGTDSYTINSLGGLDAVFFNDVPVDCFITFDMETSPLIEDWGLYLRSNQGGKDGYKLAFSSVNREVRLADTYIKAVENLNKKTSVQIIMKGDIIDICIGDKRCITDRLYEHRGNMIGLFAKHGNATFSNIKIAPILP